MDIRLNARLSAYGRIPVPSKPGCTVDEVTKEDIDSLFDESILPATKKEPIYIDTTATVSHADIDALFR